VSGSYVGDRVRISSVANVVDLLREGRGALDYTVVVAAAPRKPAASSIFWPPTPARAIAEYFMFKGKATRWWSTTTSPRQAQALPPDVAAAAPPAGREAYPGRCFSTCHSRLARRAAKLFRLPMGQGQHVRPCRFIETQAATCRPTSPPSLISITMVRIFPHLLICFNSGLGSHQCAASRVSRPPDRRGA